MNGNNESSEAIKIKRLENRKKRKQRLLKKRQKTPPLEPEILSGELYKLYSAQELFDMNVEDFPFLVEGLIPEVGLAAVVGGSAVGKSSFLRQLALSVALGESEFLGFKINKPKSKVIYISTEDEEYATSNSLIKAFGKLTNPNLNNLKFDFDAGRDTLQRLASYLNNGNGEIKLVIVDAYSDVLGGDSNKFEQVRQFLNGFKLQASEHKCAIIFLHHIGKNMEFKPPSKGATLGSQGFEAKVRLLIDLRKDVVNPKFRHVCIVKANMLSDLNESSYKLSFENMLFKNTGERTPFNALIPKKDDEPWLEKALELKDEKKTYNEIHTELTKLGYSVSRTTLAKKVKEAIEILKEE